MAKKSIKVSQATIDKIKKMGMTAALKKAGTSKNAEYIEGIRRMYGERRLSAARPAAKSADAARTMAAKKVAKPVAKSPDAARASYNKAKPMAKKAAAKKKVNWRKEGILPALKAQGPITKGKVSGPGYFKK